MVPRARFIGKRAALAIISLLVSRCGLVAGLGDDRSLLESTVGGAHGSPDAAGSMQTSDSGGAGANSGGASAGANSGGGGGELSSGASGEAGNGAEAGNGGEGGVHPPPAAGNGGVAPNAGQGGGSAGAWPVIPDGPSCADMNGTECNGFDCCKSLFVPGGPFPMGRSVSGTDAVTYGSADEVPEHLVSVSPFALDKFELTVGRFRRFATSYAHPPSQ